jgi:hypothetical protein
MAEHPDGRVSSVGSPYYIESDFPMYSYYDISAIPALSAKVWTWSLPDNGMVNYLTALYCCPNAALFLGLSLEVDGVQVLYYVKEYDVRYVPGRGEPVSYRYPTTFKVTVMNLHSAEFTYAWAMSFFEVPI